jgi:hypothetical protein
MRVSSVRWGIIFIGIGLLFLAINLELLDTLVFPRLFSLWPILLIAIGLEIMFRRTRLYFLALLSPILIAGAFIAAATATGDWGWKADEFWNRWVWRATDKKVDIVEIPSDSAIRALKLDLECGPSEVTFKPSSDILFKSTTEYYRRSPWVEHTVSDSIESIKYVNREKARLALFGLNIAAAQNQFRIADYLPIEANITALDDEPDFDLSDLKVSVLNLHIRSNRATLRLGGLSDSLDVIISGKTGDLNIFIPKSIGLAVSGRTVKLNELLKNAGLLPGADAFYSSDYSAANLKIRLELDADIKTISIIRN